MMYPKHESKNWFYKLVDRLVIRDDDPRIPEGWLKIRAVAFGVWPAILLLSFQSFGLLRTGPILQLLPLIAALWHSVFVSRVINDRIDWLNRLDEQREEGEVEQFEEQMIDP